MEFESYFRFLLALVFVLALIGVLTWLARRFGVGGGGVARTARGKRLRIVEATPIDGRRKLVLLRRDDVEHLVVLGPNAETVVETGIAAPETTATDAEPPAPAPLAGAGSALGRLAAWRPGRSPAQNGGPQ